MKYIHRMPCIKHITAIVVVLIFSLATQAQKKELGDDQYFKSNFKGITQQLPSVVKWIDDSHFILRKDGKSYEVDCKTGIEKEYVEPNINKGSVATTPEIVVKGNDLYMRKNIEDIRLTNDSAKEINQTISPDGNYIAYTKNNDLYTVNLTTKKETRLTKDGSERLVKFCDWVFV